MKTWAWVKDLVIDMSVGVVVTAALVLLIMPIAVTHR